MYLVGVFVLSQNTVLSVRKYYKVYVHLGSIKKTWGIFTDKFSNAIITVSRHKIHHSLIL